MSSPAQGLLRGLRIASHTVAGFVLALAAHVAAGGAAPGPVVLFLLAGLISAVSVLLTGVRLSPVRVVLCLTVMQVILHEAFMRLSVAAGSGMSAPGGRTPWHGPGAQPMLGCANRHRACRNGPGLCVPAHGHARRARRGYRGDGGSAVTGGHVRAPGPPGLLGWRATDVVGAVRLRRGGSARSAALGSVRRRVRPLIGKRACARPTAQLTWRPLARPPLLLVLSGMSITKRGARAEPCMKDSSS